MFWLMAVLGIVHCDDLVYEVFTWSSCPSSSFATVVARGNADSKVTSLDLKKCGISWLNPNDFLYSNLKTLNLNSNKITFLEAGTFDNLLSVHYLYLNGNGFLGKYMPSSLFSKCIQLFAVEFSNNNMVGTPADLLQGLSNLRHLYCNDCFLHEMPAFITHPVLPLENLYLSQNQISRLDDPNTFVKLTKITNLELSYNIIDYLHKDLLTPLEEIRSIDLSGNKIRRFPEQLFQNRSHLNSINLTSNIIDFIHEKAFFGTSLSTLTLTDNRLFYLPENFLSVVIGNGERTLYFYFDGNPWSCACLNKVLVQLKQLNINYESKRYDGTQKICVIIDDFKCLGMDIYFDFYKKLISDAE